LKKNSSARLPTSSRLRRPLRSTTTTPIMPSPSTSDPITRGSLPRRAHLIPLYSAISKLITAEKAMMRASISWDGRVMEDGINSPRQRCSMVQDARVVQFDRQHHIAINEPSPLPEARQYGAGAGTHRPRSDSQVRCQLRWSQPEWHLLSAEGRLASDAGWRGGFAARRSGSG